MRHLFHPERTEICFDWNEDGFRMRLANQCGDEFIVELDADILDDLLQFVLTSQGWSFEPAPEDGLPEGEIQENLPF